MPENRPENLRFQRWGFLYALKREGGGAIVPRMSKKRKEEWAFFLNTRNRITYNELCRKCENNCKQSFRAVVVLCPHYKSKRRKEQKQHESV